MNDCNLVLAVVGMAGAGKSSVVDYLVQKGWNKIYLGKVILNEVINRKLNVNEKNEKIIREELKEKYGLGYCANILLPEIIESIKNYPTVIESLYSWSEYKYLKTNITDLYVLNVYATKNIRYGRIAKRSSRSLVLEQIMQRDISEIENLDKAGPIAYADYTIINNNCIDELHNNIDLFLNELT